MFFERDQKIKLQRGMNFKAFEKHLDSRIPIKNIFYAIRIEGQFKHVKTRSVNRQAKPYPLLIDAVKTQNTFDFENINGIIIGFRCPSFMKGINVPGYHLHFLTENTKGGGHVLNFTTKNATLYIDETPHFLMILPRNKVFYDVDPTKNKEDDLDKIEKND